MPTNLTWQYSAYKAKQKYKALQADMAAQTNADSAQTPDLHKVQV